MHLDEEKKSMTKQKSQLKPVWYRIKVKGILDKHWADWFEGMTITYKGKETIIAGQVVDQSALHGLLARIRDLNLPLISVEQIESEGGKK